MRAIDCFWWEKKGILRENQGFVSSIQYHEGLNLLFSSDSQGNLIVWDLADLSKPIHRIERAHHKTIWCMKLIEDKSILLTGGQDNSIQIWDLPGLQSNLLSASSWVMSMAYFQKKQLFFTGLLSGYIDV